MVRVPKFRRHLRVEVVRDEVVIFSTDEDCFALHGRLFTILAPHINGRNSMEQIAQKLDGKLSYGSVQFGLFCFRQRGVVVEASDAGSKGLENNVDLLLLDFESTRERLVQTPVSLISLGGASAEGTKRALESLGVHLKNDGEISVVVVEDYLQKGLENINQERLKSVRPWMLIKPYGNSIWWGPLFVPGRTGCWNCLVGRLRENLWSEQLSCLAGSSIVQTGTTAVRLTGLVDAGVNLAALSLFEWIVNPDFQNIEGRIFKLDAESMKLSEHPMARVGHCSECGPKQSKKTRPFVLRKVAGSEEFDTSVRSCSPATTFDRLQHNISPITGITGGFEVALEIDEVPIYVFSTTRKFGLSEHPDWLPESIPVFRCAGRGTTRMEAKTAALCEAIERHSGIFRGNEIHQVSTYDDLGTAALHPNSVMHFSEKQLSQRRSPEGSNGAGFWIPAPLDEKCEMEWTLVHSLTGNRERYLPTALCFYGYGDETATRFCKADSNGNAAGNSIEEAIVHGFLELVERDSVAIWWYNRIPRTGIELESFGHSWFRRVQDYYRSLDREITVLEITSDLGIPTCVAISRSGPNDSADLTLGFGASFDFTNAVKRALLEMSQLTPLILERESTTSLTGLPEGVEIEDSWLRPTQNLPIQSVLNSSRIEYEKPPDDLLEECCNIATRHGLEIYYLDQTREETGLPVVKVFAPALRPYWARFGPGRLYDVPVQMKWLDKPLLEERLNPAWLSL